MNFSDNNSNMINNGTENNFNMLQKQLFPLMPFSKI